MHPRDRAGQAVAFQRPDLEGAPDAIAPELAGHESGVRREIAEGEGVGRSELQVAVRRRDAGEEHPVTLAAILAAVRVFGAITAGLLAVRPDAGRRPAIDGALTLHGLHDGRGERTGAGLDREPG